MQSRNLNNVQGIDISHHQGIIDWSMVKASGIDFVFVKATEGISFIDPQFIKNSADLNALNIPVGYYHYAHPEMNKPLDEAKMFVDVTKGYLAQLPYVLDLEGDAAKLSKDDLTAWALAFMREVKRLTGSNVMLYTNAYFARDEVGAELNEFPLWIAHYGVNKPLDVKTWDTWAVFQYTSSGSVPGIVGEVDMDEMDIDFWNKEVVKHMTFKDVPTTHWAFEVITKVSDSGIMQGYPDGTFKPDQPATRAELAVVISKLLKL